MGIVVKNSGNATIEIRYRASKGLKSIMFQPGRNVITEEAYDILKNHTGFKDHVNKDKFTINTEGIMTKQPSAIPDFNYVYGLIGQEDGKDILKEYALGWDIKLSKKKNIENMVEDFKNEYEDK